MEGNLCTELLSSFLIGDAGRVCSIYSLLSTLYSLLSTLCSLLQQSYITNKLPGRFEVRGIALVPRALTGQRGKRGGCARTRLGPTGSPVHRKRKQHACIVLFREGAGEPGGHLLAIPLPSNCFNLSVSSKQSRYQILYTIYILFTIYYIVYILYTICHI